MGFVTRTAQIKKLKGTDLLNSFQYVVTHSSQLSPPTLPHWDDISSNLVQGWPPVLGYWQLLSLHLSLQLRASWKYSVHFKSSTHHFLDADNLTQPTREWKGPRKKPSPWRAGPSLFLVSMSWGWVNRTQQRKHKSVVGGEGCWAHRWREIICVCPEDGP